MPSQTELVEIWTCRVCGEIKTVRYLTGGSSECDHTWQEIKLFSSVIYECSLCGKEEFE